MSDAESSIKVVQLALQKKWLNTSELVKYQSVAKQQQRQLLEVLLENEVLNSSQVNMLLKESQGGSKTSPSSQTSELQTIGGYVIQDVLGAGGMGKVYRAYDSQLKRYLAVKVLHPGSGENLLARFVREAEAMAKLDHPNVIRLHHIGKEKGHAFLAMDLIEGKTLEDVVKEGIDLREGVQQLCDSSKAVAYIHKQGIVHRDLKPSNIMVDPSGKPYVMDFGLAKLENVSKRLSQTGAVMGSLFYMSPEQAQGKIKKVDQRSDVYSLGVILYFILTGKLPFEGKTFIEVTRKIVESNPPSPRVINPEVCKTLESICFKTLEKNPDDRYSSAKDFAQDLENYLTDKTVEALKDQPLRQAKSFLKRNKIAIGFSFALCIVAAIIGFTYQPPKKKTLRDFQQAYQKALKSNNDKVALHQLNQIIHLQPNNTEAILNRAQIYSKYDSEKLLFDLEKVYELKPSHDESLDITRFAIRHGYFVEAKKYWQKTQKSSPDSQRLHAEILIQEGFFRDASEIFSALTIKEGKPADIVGKSLCLYETGLLNPAKSSLEELTTQTSSYRQRLLELKIAFHQLEPELMKYDWLFQQSNVETTQKKILELQKKTTKFLKDVQSDTQKTFELKNLRNILPFYQKALSLEAQRNDSQNKDAKIFATQVEEKVSDQKTRTLLLRTFLRHLMRNGKYEEAYHVSHQISQEYPWIYELYQIRAMTALLTNRFEQVAPNLQFITRRKPLDPLAFDNISRLIVSRLGQEEALCFFKIFTDFREQRVHQLWQDFWAPHLQELRNRYWSEVKRPVNNLSLTDLLANIFSRSSSGAQEAAIQVLCQWTVEQSSDVQKQVLTKVKAFSTNSQAQKTLKLNVVQLLQEAIQKQKVLKVKRLILQFEVFNQRFYLYQIAKEGQVGKKILREIIQNQEEPVVMKIWATFVLGSIAPDDIFLKEAASSEKFPDNLFARLGKRDHTLSEVWSESIVAQMTKRDQLAYRFLLASIQDFTKDPSIAMKLLESKDEEVALAAFDTFRSLEKIPPAFVEKIFQRGHQLTQSKRDKIRIDASKIFWLYASKGEGTTFVQEVEKAPKLWQKYKHELIKMLQDPVPEIQRTAAMVFVVKGTFKKIIKTSRQDPMMKKLRKQLIHLFHNDSETSSFWIANAITSCCSLKSSKFIFTSPKSTLLTKVMAAYAPKDMQTSLRMAQFIQRFAASSKKDKRKVWAALSMAITPMVLPTLEKFLHENREPILQRAALTNFFRNAQDKHIPLLRKLTKSKDQHTRRSAVAVLARLNAKRNRDLGVFSQQYISSASLIKQAVVTGYYDVIQFNIQESQPLIKRLFISQYHFLYEKKLDNNPQLTRKWFRLLQEITKFQITPQYAFEYAYLEFRNNQSSYDKTHAWLKKHILDKDFGYYPRPLMVYQALSHILLYDICKKNNKMEKAHVHFAKAKQIYPYMIQIRKRKQ